MRSLILHASLGLAVVTFIVVVVSVWVEDRFPMEEGTPRTAMVAVREVTTQPVVAVLSRQLEREIRGRMFNRWFQTQMSERETIDRFRSEQTPAGERRMLAYRLARLGTPEAIDALVAAFKGARGEEKLLLTQVLGMTGLPEMKELLLPLLEQEDEELASAAMQALGALGGEEVTMRVGEILTQEGKSEELRTVAAQVLGEMGSASAREALVKAVDFNPESEVTQEVLRSLGRLPFARVAEVYAGYLAAPEAPRELRVVAVESLAYSTKEAVSFLVKTAAQDADPQVRASAAWAIGGHDATMPMGATLTAMAMTEPEPDVRRRLYEALVFQADAPAAKLWANVLAEEDLPARIAGLNAIGGAVGRAPTRTLVAEFDRVAVPELRQVAEAEVSLNLRMRAVFALRRANSPGAQVALAVIAANPNPTVAEAARLGLPMSNANN